LYLCVCKFGAYIIFLFFCIIHDVFHALEFGFLLMLLNVSLCSRVWVLVDVDECIFHAQEFRFFLMLLNMSFMF
jgi:hypothetical protein